MVFDALLIVSENEVVVILVGDKLVSTKSVVMLAVDKLGSTKDVLTIIRNEI